MANLKISEADRAAIVLKKLITPAVPDPGYKFIDGLTFAYRDLVYAVLSEGRDKSAREARLKTELTARGLLDDLDRLTRADPAINLEEVEVRDNWQFFSLEEAYQPLPPLEWVIEGIIARPSISIFFGQPKSMKSLLIQDLVTCVASGTSWLQAPPGKMGKGFKTVKTASIWIDFENGARRMKERFSAFGKALGLTGDVPVWCTSMPTPWLDAGQPEQIGNLMRRIEHYGADLVVIDHLTQITGDADENTSQMADIMGNLRGMVEDLNLALILVHHQIKGASRYGITPSDSLRGHGSILASCDLACQIERNANNSNQIAIKPAAVRGAGVDEMAAMFSFEQKTDNSRELAQARFWGAETESIDTLAEQAALDILASQPGLTHTALRSALVDEVEGLGDYKARQVISRLERAGKITHKKGDKGAKLYYLPED